ncbi:MAG TPA: hypothetical protein VLM76_04305 [Patescibacteria group bacterium]|nr:hypothetical protein [Patescibacteria group bacterium]
MRGRGAARTAAAVVGAIGALAALAGCAGWTTDPELTLHVDSAIDRPLLVYVNGDWVGTIPAGATDAVVPASGHGGPPWTAEGRVASGLVLVTLPIPTAPAAGDGLTATAVTACGTITMTVGVPGPGPSLAPPAPGASLPPCD